ncbi:hypothetical protein CLV51_11038 [Chitinophaga niastensis]|uniref:Conjugal transfer protein TraI n=1 Tax=Chitinophaga niastensis TaxID=536980 RepID=A0A2P8H9C1_CHINA|nr:conjugal transfer protein TraI [Chitinophaga niastensis]PSL42822.1 hypothetical protein CLV51_11038 [Chitinophaga niastensis]
MKKAIVIFLFLTCSLTILPTKKSHAIIWVVVKAAIKKIIKAIDLQVQRIQNKTIALQNAQKVLENQLSKLKLNEISEWTNKQKEIYQKYFDELWKIKSAIAYFQRITEIISKQKQLVSDYKNAYALFQQDRHFTPSEIEHMYTVYSNIIAESLKSVDNILSVVDAFSLQMSDAHRLQIIDEAAAEIETYIVDLRKFNQQNISISMQRAKSADDLFTLKQLYGVK